MMLDADIAQLSASTAEAPAYFETLVAEQSVGLSVVLRVNSSNGAIVIEPRSVSSRNISAQEQLFALEQLDDVTPEDREMDVVIPVRPKVQRSVAVRILSWERGVPAPYIDS